MRGVIFLSALFFAAQVSAGEVAECLQYAKTQVSMNSCSGVDLASAEAELERVLAKLNELYADDHDFLRRLEEAQVAWKSQREADVQLKYPAADPQLAYGSAFPMCVRNFMTELTLERIQFLKRWLANWQEGDVCTGSEGAR